MALDRHVEGIFSGADCHRLLGDAGFAVETIERRIGPGGVDGIFLCRRA